MFIIFAIVLVFLGLVRILGFQIDVLLSIIPIWLAKKTAAYQCLGEFKFRAILTWLVGIAGGVVMCYDAFCMDVYFGFWPLILPAAFFLLVIILEGFFG